MDLYQSKFFLATSPHPTLYYIQVKYNLYIVKQIFVYSLNFNE